MFIGRKNTEENKAKAAARERAKRRKKMLRTKYGQKPLKHARKGVQSCALGVLLLVLLVLVIVISFRAKGDVGILMALFGIALFGCSIWGQVLGVKGLKEREKNYVTCKTGIAMNGVVLLFMTAIFIRGLM